MIPKNWKLIIIYFSCLKIHDPRGYLDQYKRYFCIGDKRSAE